MKLTTVLFLTLLSMGVQAAGKTAFINSKILLEKSPQAVVANSKLKEEFGEREQSLRKLAQGIQQMEKTYQTDSAIMSSDKPSNPNRKLMPNRGIQGISTMSNHSVVA